MNWFAATPEQVVERQFWLAAFGIVLVLVGVVDERFRLISKRPERLRGRASTLVAAALGLVLALAAVTYFYSSRSAHFLHEWDLFHTIMTTRYMEELGYDGLYECAIVLDRGASGHFRAVDRIRDLATLRSVGTEGLVAASDCESRFSPERRAAFLRDLEFWWTGRPEIVRWKHLFADKGYNGSPFYSAQIAWLVGDGPLSRDRLARLAILDVGLVIGAFALAGWAFGTRMAFFAFLFFCVNFPGRFVHMGGSILRFDYLAALVAALCFLRQDRHAAAGACLAWSTLSRGFPVIFVAALACKAAADVARERRVPRRFARFFAAFAAALALGVAFSLSAGGLEAWTAFFEDLRVHTSRSGGFRIGLAHLFMLDGNLIGAEGFIPYAEKARLFAERRVWFWLAAAAFLAPGILLARKLDDVSFTALFGLLAFFVLAVATRYYYAVLVVAFLTSFDTRREVGMAGAWILLFGMTIVAILVTTRLGFDSFAYNTLYSAMLAGFFIYVLVAAEASRAPEREDPLVARWRDQIVRN